MRKILKDINAFAMAELLVVSIVILLIFTVLFSNYLPLVGEYETRLSYNDVTSQYAAHYIRKEYKNWLEPAKVEGQVYEGSKRKESLNSSISEQGFAKVYDNNNNNNDIYNICVSDQSCKNNIEAIIKDYGIEEIIITNYKLGDSKDTSSINKYVKKTYEKKDGLLKKYIDYLPNYEKSIYTGKTETGDSDQLYRIIMKTKYGYATTPILDDYKTPGTCFEGFKNNQGLVVTKYHSEKEECGSFVTISKGTTKIIDATDSNKTLTGPIVQIGEGEIPISDKLSESAPGIEGIFIKGGLTTIADTAFKDKEKLEQVIFPDTTAQYKLSIGNNAFENTGLTEINLPAYATYGNNAFANNANLEKIDFTSVNGNMKNSNDELATNLFEKAGSERSGLSLNFPSTITQINPGMFYMAKLTNIEFSNSLTKIGTGAFAQATSGYTGKTQYTTKILEVNIPNSVTKIAEYAFNSLSIQKLMLSSNDSNQMIIETGAFYNSVEGNLIIPKNVTKIGLKAFADSPMLTKIKFEESNILSEIGEAAFKNTGIEKIDMSNSEKIEFIGRTEGIFSSCEKLEEVILPTKQDKISNYMFSNCKALTKISNTDNITEIGEAAFRECSNLENFEITSTSKLTKIGKFAFYYTKIKNYIIPKTVTVIGQKAFVIDEDIKFEVYNSIYRENLNDWCKVFYTGENLNTCQVSDENGSFAIKSSGTSKVKTITYMDSEEGING